MSTVAVVAHVNHDRIWSLATPLVGGARISYRDRQVRLGGGGFYTGSQLLRLGHAVSLVSDLRNDDHGRAALTTLREMGFDTTHVAILAGETALTEILLDPVGERTILATGATAKPTLALRGPIAADAAYINGLMLADDVVAALDDIPLVISQFPLRAATPRSADIVIGSKADFPGADVDTLWLHACDISGPRLRMLVLTDGLRPISLYRGQLRTQVDLPRAVSTADTIGAGDTFAGAFLDGLLIGLDAEAAAEGACRATVDWLCGRAVT